ncbi:hypothetical protein JAAARDRAFT_130688 [Jaapia argillacea MUCL 33604]|uniref:ML-like domain-containing protein n=1 Tax=Jaapia argillacea MUCL 33604 TaxID=933084 RepID=A0A067PS23_9AGAM|nr:hypothetical protein JAAARDRAFT_130688 [Jaapia argillacea MUCL 33604]
MFLSVARLRPLAFAILAALPLAQSRENVLFTSSVTYCAPPESLLIQQFDLTYFAANSSLFFNVSAASVEPNVNVTANVLLNVYGMHPVNFTIDLCSLFHGALCPLPMYNFTGVDSIPLPASVNIASRIPGVAYQIPDLEAFAQLTLVEVGTGQVKACIQSTLSNGWSAHQPAVEWVTGAIAILALLSGIWHSFIPESLAPFRFLDLMYLFQTIAVTAFLDLNYSSVYRAFALNFAWAMGLFPQSPTSSMQNSINNMRHLTGGSMAGASDGGAIGLVNRKLSPYNEDPTTSFVVPQSLLTKVSSLPTMTLGSGGIVGRSLTNGTVLAAQDVQTVTGSSSNVLQAGVPIYVNSIGIATANAFMTVFFVTLIMIAIALVLLALGYAVLLFRSRSKHPRDGSSLIRMTSLISFSRAWGLRLALVALSPVMIFAFYQWTLKDSWLSVLFSVVFLICIVGYVGYHMFLTMRSALRSSPYPLYTHFDAHAPLYAQFRAERYYFFIPLITATFLKALFVAFAHANGEVQVIAFTIIEFMVLVALVVLKPFKNRRGDVFAVYLAITRFVCTGLMVAFLECLNLAAIPRVVIGIIMAVVFSIAVIVVVINVIIHLGLHRIFNRKSQQPSSPHPSSDASMLEKGEKAESQIGWLRPNNPTPERNIPLDPHLNHPYPEITPTHTTSSASPHSAQPTEYSEVSASTSLGATLPRRWSLSQHDENRESSHYSSSPTVTSTPLHSTPPSPSGHMPVSHR